LCSEAYSGSPEMDPTNKWFFEVQIITDKNRTLILQANDENERAEWMEALSLHKFASSSRSQVVALADNHILAGAEGHALSIADFDLLQVVGNGAWGKVFHAVYKHSPAKSDTTYAIKVMKKKVLVMQGISKLVVQERRLMSELLHPFILTLHGHFSTPTKLYMVLKYAEGGDLSLRLKNEPNGYVRPHKFCSIVLSLARRCFGEDVARFIIAQLILAVEYMHGRGILHRDLKTENILLGADGYCLLADMGLAVYCPIARPPLCAHLGEPHTHSRVPVRPSSNPGKPPPKPLPAACTWSENPIDITGGNCTSTPYCRVMRGSFVGTPEYLAPEVVAHQSYGPEADWWSIGILLYEMLLSQTPFVCKHAQAIYLKIFHEEPM
jgi:serine/threonine protein kinase